MRNRMLLAETLADIALASAVGVEGAPAVKDALQHFARPTWHLGVPC
jgi:hypothetical protein